MKKQFITRIGIMLILSLLLAAHSTNAQIKSNNNDSKNNWITYLGSNNGTISFSISYLNPKGKRLTLRIFDKNHNDLFEGFYNDKNFHKTFCIPSDLTGVLEFMLRNTYGEVFVRSFKISSETKADVIVSSLKS